MTIKRRLDRLEAIQPPEPFHWSQFQSPYLRQLGKELEENGIPEPENDTQRAIVAMAKENWKKYR